MATPTRCTIYAGRRRTSSPGTTRSPPQRSQPNFSLDSGPDGSPCPGQVRPFTPAPRGRHVEPGRRRLQRLHPEARPRRRRPVPRRPQLQDAARLHRRPARDHLLPGGGDRGGRRAASAAPSRPRPSCPASSQIGTTNVAAGPGSPPLPRGRQDVPRRALQGRAAQPRRDHPGARRPLRLRHRRRPGRPPRRPARRPGQRRLRHGALDHRRHPDPDALDPGQHRQAQLHDQPDQLLARSRSTRRGSATRARSPTSPPTSTRSTAPTLPFKPKMTVQAGRAAARAPRRADEPAAAVRPHAPAPATPTSSRSR